MIFVSIRLAHVTAACAASRVRSSDTSRATHALFPMITALCDTVLVPGYGTPVARYHVVSAPEDRNWPVNIQFSVFAADPEGARAPGAVLLDSAMSFSHFHFEPSSLTIFRR